MVPKVSGHCIRPNLNLKPILIGGSQQAGLRPGTLPTALIIGFATATALCQSTWQSEQKRIASLRNQLFEKLTAQ